MPDQPHANPVAGRSRWSHWVIVALVVLAIYAVFQLRPFSGPNPEGLPAIHQPLPALEPLTRTVQPITLEELQGRVTLINFWATWCPPCLLEFPYILDLEGKFHAEPDFRLLSVSCGAGVPEDLQELRANTRVFLKRIETAVSKLKCNRGSTNEPRNWCRRKHRWDVPMGESLANFSLGMESQRWQIILHWKSVIA